MSEEKFKSNIDMFGCIAWIKTNYNESIHMYKVIGRIRSNSWCDVPIKHDSKPYIHECDKELEDVLLVLHCGICEDSGRIVRVALKDCERVENTIFSQVLKRLEKLKENAWDEEYQTMCEVIEIVEEEAGITCGE